MKINPHTPHTPTPAGSGSAKNERPAGAAAQKKFEGLMEGAGKPLLKGLPGEPPRTGKMPREISHDESKNDEPVSKEGSSTKDFGEVAAKKNLSLPPSLTRRGNEQQQHKDSGITGHDG